MAQKQGCNNLSSSDGSGAVDCGYHGQSWCFGAGTNRSGQLSWRQLCWLWEADKSSVLRVCHPCLCPSNSQELEEHRVQDLEDHMNTAGHAIRDAGSRAQATENLSRHAETAAGVRPSTVPTALVDT